MIAIDAALAIYRFIRWLNHMMSCFLAFFSRNAAYFYIVVEDGSQLPLTPYNYAVQYPVNLLVIYYTPIGTKYRFVPKIQDSYLTETNLTAQLAVDDIKSAYGIVAAPTYKLLGINIKIGNREYNLPTDEFVVTGSSIFSETFTRWLCRNYLHVPCSSASVTIIDESIRLLTITEEIVFHRDKYTMKQE